MFVIAAHHAAGIGIDGDEVPLAHVVRPGSQVEIYGVLAFLFHLDSKIGKPQYDGGTACSMYFSNHAFPGC